MSDQERYHQLPYITLPEDYNWSQKADAFEQALADHPEDEVKILRFLVPFSGLCPDRNKRTLQLAHRLLTIAENDRDVESAKYQMASVLIAQGKDLEKAEKLLLEILEMMPDHDGAFDLLIGHYQDQNRMNEALEWSSRMSSHDRLKYCGHIHQGETYLLMEEYAKAKEAFEKALSFESWLPTIHHGIGRSLAGLALYDDALQHFQIAFEKCHYPEPMYAYCAGLCYQNTDDPYRAMMWYKKALDIDPSHPMALNNMATLHHHLSNGWEEAVPYLLKAIELSGEAINKQMQPIYRNLWAYYTNILDHDKAAYYQKLNLMCTGFDEDTADFFGSFD